MYNSQYYTCEQIDERLLQGYVDDYNTKHSTNLTKDQFLTLLGSMFNKEFIVQQKGQSTVVAMSQKAVTDELDKLDISIESTDEHIGGVKNLFKIGERINNVLNESGGIWSSGGYSYLIPKSEFGDLKTLLLKANENYYADLAFLKNNSIIIGQQASFCDDTSLCIIGAGIKEYIDIPSDCNYIYIYDYYSVAENHYPDIIAVVDSSKISFEHIELLSRKITSYGGVTGSTYNSKALDAEGKVISKNYFNCDSKFYPILEGLIISYKFRALSESVVLCFYSEANEYSFISSESIEAGVIEGEAIVPEKAKYFRYCTIPGNGYYLQVQQYASKYTDFLLSGLNSVNVNINNLSSNINDLNNAATCKSGINKGIEINNCIHVQSSGDIWYGSGKSYLIPRSEYQNFFKKIDVKSNNNNPSYIAFLKSDTQEYVDFCDDTQKTILIQANNRAIFDIPLDCNYIYIYKNYSGSGDDYYPLDIVLCSEKYVSSIEVSTLNEEVSTLNEEVSTLNDEVSKIEGYLSGLGKGIHINNCIRTGQDFWLNGGWSYLLPKTEFSDYFKKITVAPNVSGNNGFIAFLKSDTQEYVDFCEGYTSDIRFSSETTYNIPSDCNFIYIFDWYSSSLPGYPSKIVLTGDGNGLMGLKQEVRGLKQEVSLNTKNFNLFSGKYSKSIFQELIAEIDLSLYPIDGNIIVIGDSTIAGYRTNVPVASYITVTGTKTDISQPSDTISGQTTKYNNLSSDIKSGANYIFVQIGLNDNRPERVDKTIFAGYQNLIKTLKQGSPNAKIILGMMLPCRQRYYDLFSDEQAEIAYNNYLELNSAIANSLFIGAGICACYHYTLMSDDNGDLLSMYDTNDHIHPNAAGAKVIAWSWLTRLHI